MLPPKTFSFASQSRRAWVLILHSVDAHFLSRRSIRGRRTVSASIAALLPLAEPFIWTSSWFICFTQSSMTGLKLVESKEMHTWNVPLGCDLPCRMIHLWWETWITPGESTTTRKRCQEHKNVFLPRKCSAIYRPHRAQRVLQSFTMMRQPHKKQPHRSHSNAHLEPKTPLSSSSTVLSLFCSSFSRSLASASSCQKAEKVVTTLLLHSTKTDWLDLWISVFWVVGRGGGVESCSRHRGATCLAGGLRLILPAICVECNPEYKWTRLTSEHCHDDCSPRHQMWYQHREGCLARSLKTCFIVFFLP